MCVYILSSVNYDYIKKFNCLFSNNVIIINCLTRYYIYIEKF